MPAGQPHELRRRQCGRRLECERRPRDFETPIVKSVFEKFDDGRAIGSAYDWLLDKDRLTLNE